MRRALFVAAALLLLAVAVAVWAPASLLSLPVAHATRGNVALTGTEGTVWHGRGTLVANDARAPIGWSIDPWPLLLGTARIRLEPPPDAPAAPRGVIEVRGDDVVLADTRVAFPAAMLGTNPHAIIRPAGEITLVAQSLAWQPPSARGSATLTWRDARLVIGRAALALGDVSATLSAAGNSMSGPIANEGGDVDVGGSVSLTAPAAIDVALVVHPRAGARSPLLSALGAIATPDDGGWRLRWHGSLR